MVVRGLSVVCAQQAMITAGPRIPQMTVDAAKQPVKVVMVHADHH
jgi:hypothetical protein